MLIKKFFNFDLVIALRIIYFSAPPIFYFCAVTDDINQTEVVLFRETTSENFLKRLITRPGCELPSHGSG